KDNFKAEDSPAAQASALKLTPHPILLSLSIRLLQVTAAISPPAVKGASKGWFSTCIQSEGPRRQMQDFETGTKGSFISETGSFAKRKVPQTSGSGLAVRFGAASWASLVIEFCLLGEFYLLAESFSPLYVFAG
ncbi:MAG TPA: hypothetical protein H9981_01665, partial [Candidatus Mediterraneibacter caccavium]|nr:hypothetical protein [Candidatus Mediterraneibacter caccavium]